MLGQATARARAGQRVLVIAWNLRHANDICHHIGALGGMNYGRDVMNFGKGSIFVVPSYPVNLASDNPLKQQGFDHVFIDHYAIESKFGVILEELHRYDPLCCG